MTVYSKDRGITRRDIPAPMTDRHPSYRQSRPGRVQVPPNYSGHAIVDGEERPLGSSPTVDPIPALPVPDAPTPRFDDLPQVSSLGDRHHLRTLPAPFSAVGEDREVSMEVSSDKPSNDRPEEPRGGREVPPDTESAFSQAASASAAEPARGLPLLSSARSLLRHGLGLEELLILGLILFLLHEGEGEDRGDLDETVILLALLLFLG